MSTKLYDVPRYSRVKVLWGNNPDVYMELEFDHIDGMYSYCKDDEGNVVHLAAYTPVEIIREGLNESVDS